MALSADLRALRAAVGFVERRPDIRAKPRVGPKLATTIQPFHLSPPWALAPTPEELLERAGVFGDIRASLHRPEGPEAPEGMGSSMARNSHRPRRHGFGGLTSAGRSNVSDALQLLEERRQLLSFWTVTLPTVVLRQIAWRDCWPRFVDRLLQQLRRSLERELGEALYVGVVELQTKRGIKYGLPCPHLHVVFQGRAHRNGRWLLTPALLDEFIARAIDWAGIEYDGDLNSAGNVQPVKKSVRAYLSKYMTKGSSDAAVWQYGMYAGLVPRQWWMWSDACRSMVEACTTQLPTGFMAWVWRQREELLQRGLFYLQRCEVPSEAPATWRFFWNTVANLARLYAMWQEWEEDERMLYRQRLGIFMQSGQLVYAKPLPPCLALIAA